MRVWTGLLKKQYMSMNLIYLRDRGDPCEGVNESSGSVKEGNFWAAGPMFASQGLCSMDLVVLDESSIWCTVKMVRSLKTHWTLDHIFYELDSF
jgi:hypothetical protein